MKKNISKLLLGAIIVSSLNINTAYAFEKTNVSITLNNMLQPLSSSVINKDGHTLVSFRELFNMLNIKVDWNDITRNITAKKDDITLIINVDTNETTINGKKATMPIGVEIIDGATFVPLRFACESFGMEVIWDSINKGISINTTGNGYIFLDEYYSNKNIDTNSMTFEDAINYSLNASTELKENEESIVVADERLRQSRQALNEYLSDVDSEFETYNTLAIAMYKDEQTLKDIEDNREITKDRLKLLLITKVIDIKEAELDNIVAEINLDIQKDELENTKLKYKYGLIPKNSLDSATEMIKNSEKSFESMKDSLKSKKDDLKEFLNQKEHVDISIDFNSKFSDIDNIDVDKFAMQEPESNISMNILKRAFETQKTILHKYTHDTGTIEEILNSQQMKALSRTVEDAKKSMKEKIKANYKALLDTKEANKNFKNTLEKAISSYNVVYANYINGEAIELELKKAKLNILEAEINIEKNKMLLETLLYKFYNPHI